MTLIKLYWFLLLFSFLGLNSCSGDAELNDENTTINSGVQVEENATLDTKLENLIASYPVLVVISEKSCLSCNKKVVEVTSNLVGNENFAVVLETAGGLFDISPLLKDEFTNQVIIDNKRQLSKKFKMSKTFILTKDKMDAEGYEKTAISSENADQFEAFLLESLNKTKKAS